LSIARGDAVALTRELVRVDSRNPSLVDGGPGESVVAKTLAAVLHDWGLRVDLQHAAPHRPNVIARAGRAGGRTLMFNGHLDVVGVEGMTHAPWDAFQREGRLYGRGSADMKGGVAAMCAAAARAANDLEGQVVITAVVDEEFESIGTRALVAAGVRADAAIVTEPTGLAIMPAHLGFVWADVTTHGRAAHGSRWELGVDAIRHAGFFLTELDRIDSEDLPQKSHPLLGRPSVHASLIDGGTGMSTYPDQCRIRIERRTIPGEKPGDVERELREACERIALYRPGFEADVQITFSQEPSDVSVEAPIVHALAEAISDDDDDPRVAGMSAWTDAAILNAAGIPAVCFGPGDIALAHAAEEYVPVFEIERATTILASLAKRWCSARIT
jgi:acetylornithine deacetylase